MKTVGHMMLLLFTLQCAFGTALSPDFPAEGIVSKDYRGFIDPKIDYTHFSGRVSDKDETGRVLKIKVENNNTKFFKNGDYLEFHLANESSDDLCVGYVRTTEDFYFTMYVQDFSSCFKKENNYFRRGTILRFKSDILAQRVFEGSKMREMLLIKKDDFLKQLNDINHFFWSFDQEKIKVTAQYDQQLNELRELKRKAIGRLLDKKKEYMDTQVLLMSQLNKLDEEIHFYRVERQEKFIDRWNGDHDTGLPFGQRPMAMKQK